MIHIIAFIAAKPGQREALLNEFRQVMPLVHAEDGCIEYRPVVDTPAFGFFQAPIGPDAFVVIEKWETAEKLRAHVTSAHMTAYHARTKELIAGRVVRVLSDI